MIPAIRAITLDLDDTLWPFAPIGARIETTLHAWFEAHSPRTAERFPITEMRALRERVMTELPELAHDLGLLRRLTIERALRESGDDPELASAAYAIFFRERNQVDFFPDALDGLRRIAAHLPIAALTNGNADLAAIGIAAHFRFELTAREYGAPKPDAGIFLDACRRLDAAPEQVLHVGDDPRVDIAGAAHAGLRTCWIDRGLHAWPESQTPADLRVTTLTALADWLDAGAVLKKVA
ncbi:MAG: HAD-IA family hydrolase [Thermomonas sp.]|uniref:HAD family hydrolase n=1 Tax=Thermomonas sp. TaxID=1971895 RepID=UPI001DDB4E45|nr:HAD-IA family hydrolase [Thermomonas sp.]MBZ0087814.1 HAD-IA family hydrolase [Thermomonas sp.]